MGWISKRAMAHKISGIQIPQGLAQQVACVLVCQQAHFAALTSCLAQQTANVGQLFRRIEMKINLRHRWQAGRQASGVAHYLVDLLEVLGVLWVGVEACESR